jgi:uncharacterized repeat protein (TIGR03837 family)
MQWDVFCRVIDNFGDIGVCWRLAVDLSERGHQVRLWVDDASALRWMAPQLRWQPAEPGCGQVVVGLGQPGVQVWHWADAERDLPDLPMLEPGDVVIEAFGCNPPDAFIERMQGRARRAEAPCWINLEYLSAEDYVERSHGLVSPIWSGAGAGLKKHFFFPGFTPRTGGLLREPDLILRRTRETSQPSQRQAILASVGVGIALQDHVLLVFCYDSAPLGALLDRLAAAPQAEPRTHVLLTPGAATRLGRAWLQRALPTPTAQSRRGALVLHELPALPQPVFDQLLWCSDLNLVRGEDTAVRALWAARPHIWHIYEQDDGVHASKLKAFMARWMRHWPAALREEVSAWWWAWNNLGPMPDRLPAWHGSGPTVMAPAPAPPLCLGDRPARRPGPICSRSKTWPHN